MENNIQVRSEETGLNYFDTLEEAFASVDADKSIHKISFSYKNDNDEWVLRRP